MKMSGNTILVTGATSGIGLALAKRFLAEGNTVIICGRRKERLDAIKKEHPDMIVRKCDLSKERERISLFKWATEEFPELNVLVNNAGIQRHIQLPPNEPWSETGSELETNLSAPIHLSLLFVPHFLRQKDAAILNVTSGLSFVPLVRVPIYSATKAAMHSFTLSLRATQMGKGVEVIEIIPPAVETDLGGPGLHKGATPVDEFVDAVMKQLAEGKEEVTHGFSAMTSQASRADLDATFLRMNAPRQ